MKIDIFKIWALGGYVPFNGVKIFQLADIVLERYVYLVVNYDRIYGEITKCKWVWRMSL